MPIITDSYAKNKDKYLSTHFQLKEFASTDGVKLYTDTVKYNTELITMLEKLFQIMDCSKIIVNSGYRCPAHDKAVGGSGSGQHVNGNAADIVCYGKNGNVINAKIVCCIAADLGFNGVANISSRYRAVHVDVRSGSKYYGDESKKDSLRWRSIWYRNSKYTDFYKYWGRSKSEEETYRACTFETTSKEQETPTVTETKTIDIRPGTWNIRCDAGTSYGIVTVIKGGVTLNYDTYKMVGKVKWYHLPQYNGYISGSATYITE